MFNSSFIIKVNIQIANSNCQYNHCLCQKKILWPKGKVKITITIQQCQQKWWHHILSCLVLTKLYFCSGFNNIVKLYAYVNIIVQLFQYIQPGKGMLCHIILSLQTALSAIWILHLSRMLFWWNVQPYLLTSTSQHHHSSNKPSDMSKGHYPQRHFLFLWLYAAESIVHVNVLRKCLAVSAFNP